MKIILTADKTNMLNHRLFFLTGFLATIPRDIVHPSVRWLYEKIIFSTPPSLEREATQALYGMRKVEAALLEEGFQVEVVPWNKIHMLSKDELDAFAVSAMDPLGYGPATTMARMFLQGTPYNAYYFEKLIEELRDFQKPIVVGGAGAWQFEVFPEEQDRLGIDYVVMGESESIIADVFKKILRRENLPRRIYAPTPSRIPCIVKPSYWGFVEISRGCDRSCRFCDPSTRAFRWIPKDQILKEVKVNLKEEPRVTLHSEDIFRYGCKPGEWKPNSKLLELFKEVKAAGAQRIVITHGTLTSAVAAPDVIKEMACIIKRSPEDYAGVQVGVETGSPRLISMYMRGKTMPFKPEDWHGLVADGFRILTENRIIPAATLVAGLPGEEEEDVDETISLVKELKSYPGLIVPLAFVPLGRLKDKDFPKTLVSDVYRKLYSTCATYNAYWTRHFSERWLGNLGPKILLQIGAMLLWKAAEALESGEPIPLWRPVVWSLEESMQFTAKTLKTVVS